MNNMSLATLVKEARLNKKISQRELTRRTGVNNNTISKIEKGERKKPNILILKKLSLELELELDFEKLMKLSGYTTDEIAIAAIKIYYNV